MRARRCTWAACAAAAAFLTGWGATPASADTVVFDFEETVDTGFSGAYGSLSSTKSGLTLSLTREGGVAFDTFNAGSFGADPSFGTRSLNPFAFETSNTAFVANFSSGVTSVGIDMGDFGADTDTLLLQAFSGANATGTLLDTATATLVGGGNSFSFVNVSVGDPLIASIRFIGGSALFPNSLYYDNITVTTPDQPTQAVPVPLGAWGGMALLGGLGAARRLRRRDVAPHTAV